MIILIGKVVYIKNWFTPSLFISFDFMARKNKMKNLYLLFRKRKYGQIIITRDLYFNVIAKQGFYFPNHIFCFPDSTVYV